MKKRPFSSSLLSLPLACALAALLAAPAAHAVNANWTGGGSDALWSNTSNWSASPVPGTGNTATFNAAAGAGGAVIDLGAGVTVNTISFVGPSFAAYTIGAGGANAQSLVLNGSGNAGFAASGTATTAQITINAALTINNSQQWVINNGANPWIVNGNVTPNGTAGSTTQLKINGRNVQFNGILADQAGGAKLQISGANGATTAILTNANNSFTGGLYFDNGGVSVNSIGMTGSNSAAGAGGDLLFGSGFGGGTFTYTGTGDTTDRVIRINNGFHGATITQSGASGNLKFTSNLAFAAASTAVGSPTVTFNGSTNGTGEYAGNLVDNGTTGFTPLKDAVSTTPTNSLKLHSVDGITVGAAVSGTGIAAGTTVTSVNPTTKVITLSANTTAAISQGTNINVAGLVNITHVTKSGTGTWALSGTANTFSGNITLNSTTTSAGTLSYASAAGTNAITFNQTTGFGSTLSYTGSSPLTMSGKISAPALTTGQIILAANGTSPTATINYSNTTSLDTSGGGTADRFVNFAGSNTGDNIFAGTINNGAAGGKVQVSKSGSGKWVLTGNGNYTGGFFVNEGSVSVPFITNGGSASPLGAATRINLGRDNNDGTLIYTGSGNSTNRDVRIGGPSAASGTGGSVIRNDGTGALVFTAATFNPTQTGITFNRTLTLGGSHTGSNNEIQGVIQNNTASTGLVNVAKTGDSTWALSGNNTYTGTTTVSEGTLLINGNSGTATGAVTVNGGTFGGTGAIGGSVTVNSSATLAPGASIESLASGALTFNHGSTFAYEVDSNTVSADLMKVSGDLGLNGTVTLSLDDLASVDTTFANTTVFSLINYTGSWNSGRFTVSGNLLDDEEVFTIGLNTWKISYDDAEGGSNFSGEHFGGADSFVNITIVPEPATALLGGLGLLVLLRRRRD